MKDNEKFQISQKLADRVTLINKTINEITPEEWDVLNETIEHIDGELIQIEGFQSMFNPTAAEHKADNRRQAQRRLKLLKEWKALMDLAMTSSIKQVKAVKDMEALSGLLS